MTRSTWMNFDNGCKARITMSTRLAYQVEFLANGEWLAHCEYNHLIEAERWLREMGFARVW